MTHSVECLACGLPRIVVEDPGECPRCGYVGWAPVEAVSEEMRQRLRDVPVAQRRPHGGRVIQLDDAAGAGGS